MLRRRLFGAALALALLSIALFSAAAGAEHRIVAPEGSDVGLPFSPGVEAGDFLYLAGALGNEPGTTDVSGDAATQTRRALQHLEAVLSAAGMDFSRVVNVNIYLADSRLAPAVVSAYNAVMQTNRPPLATIEADLAVPGALIELSMIAARPGVEVRSIVPKGWPSERTSWGMLAGDTLFVAGMASPEPTPGEPGAVEEQLRRTMQNVGAVLKSAGMGYDDLAACRVFLTDARDFAALNRVYPTFFTAAPPARATVRARLTDPRLAAEVQCVAVRDAARQAVLAPGDEPRNTLSPAIQAGGRLFLSGMLGRGPDGYPPSVAEQTRLTLERLKATLAAAGLTFRDVVDATVYLTDIRHFSEMNAVYRDLVGTPPPARATVGTQLMAPEALVEIQMTAVRPSATEPTTEGESGETAEP